MTEIRVEMRRETVEDILEEMDLEYVGDPKMTIAMRGYSIRIKAAYDFEMAVEKARAAGDGFAEAERRMKSDNDRLKDALRKIDTNKVGHKCELVEKTDQCRSCAYIERCDAGIAHVALMDGGAE